MIGILGAVLPSLFGIVDQFVEDKDKSAELKAKLQLELLSKEKAVKDAAAKVVLAEVQGESWLQRSWRPILMLFFAALVGGYWFGFTPPNLSPSSIDSLFLLVQIGIGGYVGGRSLEKISANIAPVLQRDR